MSSSPLNQTRQKPSDKEPVWRRLVKKYDLLDYSFQDAAAWPFGEAIFNLDYDVMTDTTKSSSIRIPEVRGHGGGAAPALVQFQRMRFIPS